MKYGQAYKAALANNDFPTSWISAAVSYSALKKCIKQIQTELAGLGLDAETLQSLDSTFGVSKDVKDLDEGRRRGVFTPELWVAVDAQTGHFLHAGLTSSTKDYLGSVKNSPDLSRDQLEASNQAGDNSESSTPGYDAAEQPPAMGADAPAHTEVVWKQVPLNTVTSFFGSLEPALAGLKGIQDSESTKLRSRIDELGRNLSAATFPPSDAKTRQIKAAKNDLEVWRQLFELYTETPIFFSTHEQDHGSRPYEKAKKQLQIFSDNLVTTGLVKKFRSPASRPAFESFVNINLDILRILHFEEMNAVAVRKIMKKFDKRTHLQASKNFQSADSKKGSSPLARSVAYDMCAEIATNVLAVVPCVDDYACPVCCELAWKPVKLGCCSAVLCIRCVIKLQQDKEERCPMCRTASVKAADARNLDLETMAYLQKYFPKDVKIRQAANERATMIDLHGPHFYRKTCVIM